MRIIGYTFAAAAHCVECTRNAWADGLLDHSGSIEDAHDELGLPVAMLDREGNPVRPVFSTDEGDHWCDDCNALLGGFA